MNIKSDAADLLWRRAQDNMPCKNNLIKLAATFFIGVAIIGVAIGGSVVAIEVSRPALEHLPNAEVIVAADYIKTDKNNCMKLKKEFIIKGGVKEYFYVCRSSEIDLDLDYIKGKFRVVLFLDHKDGYLVSRFSCHSVAYVNENNCVAMPSVVDDETGDLLLESFEKFVARFGVRAPESFHGRGACDKW